MPEDRMASAHKAACKIAAEELAKVGSTVEGFDRKIAELTRGATMGNVMAQSILSLSYLNGVGVAANKGSFRDK